MNKRLSTSEETKICTDCGKAKPLSAFQYIKTQGRYVAQCKDCINEKRRALARKKGVKPKEMITDLERGVKKCSGCKQEKPLEEFYYNKANKAYNYLCKECARAKDKQSRLAKGIMSADERNLENISNGFIICHKCKNKKPLAEYDIDKRTGNYSSICNECKLLHYREYQEKNKEQIAERYRGWYEKNKDKILDYQKDYRENNKEKIAERDKAYRIKNADKVRARQAEYYRENKDRVRESQKDYYERNFDKIREYQRDYREKNAERIFLRRKAYREKNADVIRERKKEYARTHKDHIKAYYYTKLREDQLFALKAKIRNLIGISLRARGYGKNSSTAKILGCDYETFFRHLQDTWFDNYGIEWDGEPYHIDHIIPLATAKTEQDVINLCHYTNLQMLKPEDNLNKRDSLDWKIRREEQ